MLPPNDAVKTRHDKIVINYQNKVYSPKKIDIIVKTIKLFIYIFCVWQINKKLIFMFSEEDETEDRNRNVLT